MFLISKIDIKRFVVVLVFFLGVGLQLKASSPFPYPVIAKGSSPLIDKNIHYLRAYSFRDGNWKSTPVQIDEKNKSGEYVLEEGIPFTKYSDDGIFDENDEIALDGGDFGDFFKSEDIPKEIVSSSSVLWRLKANSNGKNYGFLLLTYSNSNVYKKFEDGKVHFDSASKSVTSEKYRYSFNSKHPILLGEVFLKRGQKESSLFSSSIFKMPLIFPWFAPNFIFSAQDFKSEIECWRNGPVRSIVAVGIKFKKLFSFINLHFFSELVFYRNALQIPTVMEFPFSPAKFARSGTGVAYAIKYAEDEKWELETNLHDLPSDGPKSISHYPSRASDFPYFFASGKNKDNLFYLWVRVDKNAAHRIPPPFIIRKSMFGNHKYTSNWDWLNGLDNDIGFYVDLANVPKGTYDFGLDLILASRADGSDGIKDYSSVKIQWEELPSVK